MKKVLFIIILVFPLIANSQNSELTSYIEKYSGKEGYTSVYITKYMFEIFAKINSENEQDEFTEIVKNLESINILVDETENSTLATDVVNSLKSNLYKELMTVKESDETVNIYIKEADNVISELILVVTESTETVVLSIAGIIDLKNIAKLSKSMDINGIEHLEEIDKK